MFIFLAGKCGHTIVCILARPMQLTRHYVKTNKQQNKKLAFHCDSVKTLLIYRCQVVSAEAQIMLKSGRGEGGGRDHRILWKHVNM